MRQSVRVIVYNGDEEYAATLRSDLLSTPGVQIVAEVDEVTLIEQAVQHFPAEVLVVHLDPLPDMVLPAAGAVAESNPELAVFVVSEKSDGQYVLSAFRSGIREFLTKPVDRKLLSAAIEKVVSQRNSAVEVGSLISVLGTIGGCGASMLAVNLAAELTEFSRSRPVAVVDLDFRYGQLGTMLDLQADYTIADLCDTPEQLDSGIIEKAMVKHSSGVHLLARPNQFSQADQITAAHCASVLSSLQQMYEYVVVDGPNRFDPGGLTVVDLSDANLLLIQLLVTSVRNVNRMLDELRHNGYNMDRFHLICNRVDRESTHLEISHVEETLQKRVAHQLPEDWKTASSSINMGLPLKEYAPKARLRLAIRDLAAKLAQADSSALTTSANQGGGLISRLFS